MSQNIHQGYKIIESNHIETSDGSYTYTLYYADSIKTASMGIRLYSISVEFVDREGVRGFAEAKEFFADKRKALEFYNRLVGGLATPLNLPYIIEDELFS